MARVATGIRRDQPPARPPATAASATSSRPVLLAVPLLLAALPAALWIQAHFRTVPQALTAALARPKPFQAASAAPHAEGAPAAHQEQTTRQDYQPPRAWA